MKTRYADAVIEALITCAREGLKVRELVFSRAQFLVLAVELKVDIPELRAVPVLMPTPACTSFSSPDYEQAQLPAIRTVRVGSSFSVYGPYGMVTIRMVE